MINNRQGGRRRGRGGQGSGRNLGGQPGNRQDNRQRGNAAQLLEKYKSMARDSQLAGDRVQTEYYLQYAEHYFRVLDENRSRFEGQAPRRQRDDDLDGDDGEDEMVEADAEGSADDEHQDRSEHPERQSRGDRQDRGERFNRQRRPRDEGDDRPSREAAAEPARVNGGETIPFDALPPAIGRDEEEAPEEEPRRPKRRTRAASRPSGDEDEIAPAA
ncbi:MAG: DUF4167 domain-containing protein [Pseudomonadota bacterium]